MPVQGGLDEQPWDFVQMMALLKQEIALYEQEQVEREKARAQREQQG